MDGDAGRGPDCLAIMLGPYRNLSTLAAACLALHPAVQVLNHGATRSWQAGGLDFFADPREDVLRRFLAWALAESAGGRRGMHGGSIMLAHAFDDPALRDRYRRRFGDRTVKRAPRCLVWKDSLVIQNRLMADAALLPALPAALPAVRFFMPIRHPLDCALSNIRTGKSALFADRASDSLPDVLDAVLRAYAWVLAQRDRWPDRFLVFTQDELPAVLGARLATFLGVPATAEWLDDFAAAFRVLPARAADDDIRLEQQRIATILAPWPEIRTALAR